MYLSKQLQLKKTEQWEESVTYTAPNITEMLPSTNKTEMRSCQFWVWLAGYHVSHQLTRSFPVIRTREKQKRGETRSTTF